MVGREHEMATLLTIFRRAVDEHACRMATVIADAGVGKSRLVREFTDLRRRRRRRCCAADASRTARASRSGRWSRWPARRPASSRTTRQDEARSKLAALTGDEAVTARLASAIGLSNEQFPVAETFWAARRFLEVLGKDKPVTVVIDDIHWAEQTFLELIVHLVERVEGASVLLLCTSRHDLLETQAEWALDPNAERIVLQPLTDEDAARVVSGLLGEAGIAGEVQDRIVVAAEGNPLFVEQMLSMMIDSGSLHFADERWEPTGNLADLDVPPSIQALLAARLDLLGREERVGHRARVGDRPVVRRGGRDGVGPRAGARQGAGPPVGHDAQAIGAVDPGRQPGGARLPLPAHPHPRRRLQRAPQAGASRPSTSSSPSGLTS